MSRSNQEGRRFRVISAGTLKGGVGKSNVIFNMAGILAEEFLKGESLETARERILLIDADPQFNLTNNAGIDVRAPGLKTTQQIFESSASAEELIYRSPVKGLPNLDIIPASLFLTKTETGLVSRTGREFILTNFIERNSDFFNSRYRYIFIDTNPNLYMINQNVFMAADDIIIVSDCSFNSISGAEFFMALWSELKSPLHKSDNFRAIIVNKYDTRPNKRSVDFLEYCNDPANEEIAKLLIKQYIPLNERIADTETAHTPINILAVKTSSEKESKNRAVAAYNGVICELKERGILYA